MSVVLAIGLVMLAAGVVFDALALLADAGHVLTDIGATALAPFAGWMAARSSGPQRTFGCRRTEILAAPVNGVTLVAFS